MKRLKKKAWGTIALYHATSLQYFVEIMNSGQIMPGGYTGKISGGGHKQYLDLAQIGDQTTDKYEVVRRNAYSLYLNIEKSSSMTVLSDDLKDKVNELRKEYPNDGELAVQWLRVKIESPSGNQIGVYLGKSEADISTYFKDSSKGTNTNLPDASVVLQINAEEDALGPDLDDGDINPNIKVPYWKQTLDVCGQCVHNGPVPISSIQQVKVISGRFAANKMGTMEASQWAENYIQFDTWMDTTTASAQINQMFQDYQNLTQDTQQNVVASNSEKRLIRKLSGEPPYNHYNNINNDFLNDIDAVKLMQYLKNITQTYDDRQLSLYLGYSDSYITQMLSSNSNFRINKAFYNKIKYLPNFSIEGYNDFISNGLGEKNIKDLRKR